MVCKTCLMFLWDFFNESFKMDAMRKECVVEHIIQEKHVPMWKFKWSCDSSLTQNKPKVYIKWEGPHGRSNHPKMKRLGVQTQLKWMFQIACCVCFTVKPGFMNCCSVSPGSGHCQLHWTLANPQRSLSSSGVKVKKCDSPNHPRASCSRLMITQLSVRDTGTYSCNCSRNGSVHVTSTYVFVKGSTSDILSLLQDNSRDWQ